MKLNRAREDDDEESKRLKKIRKKEKKSKKEKTKIKKKHKHTKKEKRKTKKYSTSSSEESSDEDASKAVRQPEEEKDPMESLSKHEQVVCHSTSTLPLFTILKHEITYVTIILSPSCGEVCLCGCSPLHCIFMNTAFRFLPNDSKPDIDTGLLLQILAGQAACRVLREVKEELKDQPREVLKVHEVSVLSLPLGLQTCSCVPPISVNFLIIGYYVRSDYGFCYKLSLGLRDHDSNVRTISFCESV